MKHLEWQGECWQTFTSTFKNKELSASRNRYELEELIETAGYNASGYMHDQILERVKKRENLSCIEQFSVRASLIDEDYLKENSSDENVYFHLL